MPDCQMHGDHKLMLAFQMMVLQPIGFEEGLLEPEAHVLQDARNPNGPHNVRRRTGSQSVSDRVKS